MITFKDLPNTETPVTAENLNSNFSELNIKIGSIIESGTNENGSYVKFSDGTMICTKSYSSSVSITAPLGNIYYNGFYDQAGDLPQNFTQIHSTLVNVINDYNVWSSTSFGATTTTWPSRVNVYSAQVRNSVPIRIDMMVIGKWN